MPELLPKISPVGSWSRAPIPEHRIEVLRLEKLLGEVPKSCRSTPPSGCIAYERRAANAGSSRLDIAHSLRKLSDGGELRFKVSFHLGKLFGEGRLCGLGRKSLGLTLIKSCLLEVGFVLEELLCGFQCGLGD